MMGGAGWAELTVTTPSLQILAEKREKEARKKALQKERKALQEYVKVRGSLKFLATGLLMILF